MTIKLFVRPLPPASRQTGQLEWALYSFDGERIGSGHSDKTALQEVVEQYNLEDVMLHFILPASEFSCLEARIPARQTRYVQQALPFAIEESVAEDIEDMHLVMGEKLSKEKYPVLVSRTETIRYWYDFAINLGFPLYGIYIDAELSHSGTTGITIFLDGEDALVYEQGASCMRTPTGNLLVYLELIADKLSGPGDLLVLVSEQAQKEQAVLLAQCEQIKNISMEVSTFSTTAFEVLCASFFVKDSSINLCCPQFPGIAEASGSGLKKWWPLAAVAAVWFCIQVGFDITEGFLYQQKAGEYREQSVSIYKKLFPQERTIASPRRQLEGKLRNAGSSTEDTGFLVILGDAGYELSRQPQKANMTMNNLQYSDKRSELAIEVSAPTLDDLDSYKQSLTQAGYRVGIGSAVKEDRTVRGKLTVQGG